MKKIKLNNFFLFFIFIFIPILSLIIGFIFEEDLSTGGAKWDFEITWPLIIDYSNYNFFDAKLKNGADPRHLPFHYLILSIIFKITNEQYLVRLFYLFFSLLLPVFLYLNLTSIYYKNKKYILILSFSFLFLPFVRSSALWANVHLTALIFFLISNYFYLKSIERKKLFYKYLNLLFLAFSTYTLQTYVVLFSFYLYQYYVRENFKMFLKLFFFCVILAIPSLIFLSLNEKMLNLPITKNIFYTITNNFSIIFFFLIFFLINKFNFKIFLKKIIDFNEKEFFFIIIVFVFTIYNLDYSIITSNMRGGGFFYKVSFFLFGNNIIFLFSFFLSLFYIYTLIKIDSKFLIIIILINIMGLNYQIYQKYYEPLLLVMIFILFENVLSKNILEKASSTFLFYLSILIYFTISLINFHYGFSQKLTI